MQSAVAVGEGESLFGQDRLTRAWLLLATGAFAVSTLYALVLVLARTPGIGAALGLAPLFRAALVAHVIGASVIWFLAFAAAAWSGIGLRSGGRIGWLAFVLAAGGVATLFAAPLFGGSPVLSNYIPVIDSPLFLAGLVWFSAGITIAALRALLTGYRDCTRGPWATATYLSTLPVLCAVAAVSMELVRWSGSSNLHFEAVFWGAGHALQFTHLTLMLGLWHAFAQAGQSRAALGSSAARAVSVVAVAPALMIPVLVALSAPREYYSALMALAMWFALVPALIAGGRGLLSGAMTDAAPRDALVWAYVLLVAGLAAGTAIRGDNLLVPAHYHGAIGAVSLTFMVAVSGVLRTYGAEPQRRIWVVLTGGGLLLLVGGLAWSALYGLARKTPLLAGTAEPGVLAAGVLMGIGGTLAISGNLLFLFNYFKVIRDHLMGVQHNHRDRRLIGLAMTFAVIAVGGALLSVVPRSVKDDLPGPAAVHARQARTAEIDQRFAQAVIMLHSRQFEHAATALHRVLELAPDMPEAHVNMGYAMIGLERYSVARDFFESATVLRPQQANAYYGLALALDALRDRPGARGAMRTFIHLSAPDAPFVKKAKAAIWEWESEDAAPGAPASGKKGK